MIEPICAVCGETKLSKLHGFNYGVCLCDRCVEIAAHSFIKDNAERKLKETENKESAKDVEGMSKAEYESMTELKDKLRKEIEENHREDAKKMMKEVSEGLEAIRKAIFDVVPDETKYRKLMENLERAKSDRDALRRMYRNRLEKFTNLMSEHKKLMENYNKVRREQDSWSVKFVDVQLDANRYRKRCDELHEQLKGCVKRANRGILAASATGLLVGMILGYLVR